MLKTNSKQARENIRAYIMNNFDPCGYDVNQKPETFDDAARIILDVFRSEKFHLPSDIRYYSGIESRAFSDWCAGLPSILDTCYYYNRSAVADLAAILEETDAESKRYSETDAEKLLTYLIYRELKKGETK